LFITALVITLLVLARIWTGPDGWHIGTLALPPFRPYRFFTIGAALALIALLSSDALRASWRRRDVVIFYLVGAFVFWFLALGPEPTWRQQRLLTYGPYRLFFELHIPAVVRVSARAWVVSVTCLAVLASFGTAALLARTRRHAPALALIAGLIVAEAWFNDGAVAVPEPMRPGIIPSGAVVLEVPFDDPFVNAAAQYRGVIGGYRTVNGHSGYYPLQFLELIEAFKQHRYAAIDDFRGSGGIYVVVRAHADPLLDAWLVSQGAAEVSTLPGGIVYRLPARREDAHR
jgi:hypothetical protein